MRAKRWISFAGVYGTLALLLLTVVGCGGSNDHNNVKEAHVRIEEAAATEEVAEPERVRMEPDLNTIAKLHMEDDEGYSAKVMLRRGSVETARLGARNGPLVAGSGCEIDYEKDAVEPFQLTMTNTTTGYSASPSVEILAIEPEIAPGALLAELDYTAGPECTEFATYGAAEEGYTLRFGPTDPLEPSEYVSARGYFVIPNYYSPSHPNGDSGKLAGMALFIRSSITNGELFTITGASGAKEVLEGTYSFLLQTGGEEG